MEEHETNVGLRAQMPPPLRRRPAALRKPVPQLVSEHAACPCSSGAPPSLPVLADRAADVVDSSSLRFFTASSLEVRREEEE